MEDHYYCCGIISRENKTKFQAKDEICKVCGDLLLLKIGKGGQI